MVCDVCAFHFVMYFLYSDLAVHIDGFIAAIAHTLVVGCSASDPVTDRRADVINAAHLCSEAALRLVKAGNKVITECLVMMFT